MIISISIGEQEYLILALRFRKSLPCKDCDNRMFNWTIHNCLAQDLEDRHSYLQKYGFNSALSIHPSVTTRIPLHEAKSKIGYKQKCMVFVVQDASFMLPLNMLKIRLSSYCSLTLLSMPANDVLLPDLAIHPVPSYVTRVSFGAYSVLALNNYYAFYGFTMFFFFFSFSPRKVRQCSKGWGEHWLYTRGRFRCMSTFIRVYFGSILRTSLCRVRNYENVLGFHSESHPQKLAFRKSFRLSELKT